MLAATPALKAQLFQAAVDFVENGVMSGSGVTEENMSTISHMSAQTACLKFATDVSTALDNWMMAIVLIDPGAEITVGSAVSQTVITAGTIIKS